MDWDTFYEEWAETHEYEDMPDDEDFRDWLFDKADRALGDM